MPGPAEIIEGLVQARKGRSRKAILAELTALSPLPDEDDPFWRSRPDGRAPDAALLYVALLDIAAARGLAEAAPLFLARASYGDFGELMRSLPAALDAMAGGDAARLRRPCLSALKSKRRGTRLWAVATLGHLRDAGALPALRAAAKDPAPRIREEAELAIELVTSPARS